MIAKLLILTVLLGLCPPVVGCLWTGRTLEERGNLGAAYLYGLFTMLTVFEVLAVPMCYKRTSLTLLTRTYLAVLGILILVSLIRNRFLFKEQWRWLFGLRKKITPLLLVVLACVLLQGAYVTKYQHIDEDDAFYLATASTSVATDTLYKYSPYTGKAYRNSDYKGNLRYIMASWPIFIAVLAKTSGMHPTVLAHMVLPAVVVFWVYLIYFLMAGWLYPAEDEKKKRSLFLFFITVLLSFSGFSVYSGGLFPLIRGWQGKAVLAGMGLPALLYMSLLAMKQEKISVQWLVLFFGVGGAVAFSSMGIVLSCVMVGSVALVRLIQTKNIRYLLNSALVCMPAILCAVVYLIKKL